MMTFGIRSDLGQPRALSPRPRAALLCGLAAYALLPLPGWCLSVGEARLLSRFGQPLEVQIPIELSSPSEIDNAESLDVRILSASDPAAQDNGLPPFSSDALQIKVSGTQGHYVVSLSGSHAVMEPIGVLTLDIRADGTRLVHEVPLIFDIAPAAPHAAVPAPLTAPIAVATPAPVAAAQEQAAPALPTTTAQAQTGQSGVDAPAVAATPRAPHHHHHRIQPAPLPQAGPASGVPDTANLPTPPLRRFQISENFDSYIELAAAGNAPQAAPAAPPATAPIPAPAAAAPQGDKASAAATPAAELPARMAAAPIAPPQPASQASEGGSLPNWRWWTIAVLLLLIFGRSLRAFGGALAAAARRIPQLLRPAETKASTAVETSVFAATPAPRGGSMPMAATPGLRLAAEATLPNRPAAGGAAEALRQRLAAVSRGSTQTDPWLMVVEAHLDLGRLDAAEKVLSELEAANSPIRPRVTLVKG